MTEYKNFLLFKDLSPSETEKALSLLEATEKEYSRGETLFSGEKLSSFGLVLSGGVRVCFEELDGNNVVMANCVKGDSFGESLCWLEKEAASMRAYSPSGARVLWMSLSALRGNTCDALTNKIKNNLLSLLASRTLSMNDRIQVLSKPTIREKITVYLNQCARDGRNKTFNIPFDREALAAYLGVNRSALSRELSNMKREGLIDFYKNSFSVKTTQI